MASNITKTKEVIFVLIHETTFGGKHRCCDPLCYNAGGISCIGKDCPFRNGDRCCLRSIEKILNRLVEVNWRK